MFLKDLINWYAEQVGSFKSDYIEPCVNATCRKWYRRCTEKPSFARNEAEIEMFEAGRKCMISEVLKEHEKAWSGYNAAARKHASWIHDRAKVSLTRCKDTGTCERIRSSMTELDRSVAQLFIRPLVWIETEILCPGLTLYTPEIAPEHIKDAQSVIQSVDALERLFEEVQRI